MTTLRIYTSNPMRLRSVIAEIQEMHFNEDVRREVAKTLF